MDRPTDTEYRRAPHVAAMVTLCGLFPLLFVGAGVTSKGAGMAYPDWPTSGGYLANPPGWWSVESTRWEHGHRLIGWGVGLSALALAVLTWNRGSPQRGLGLGTFVAIGLQGVLGGIRVIGDSIALAMVHGIWGQACFCLAALTALITSHSWAALGPPLAFRSSRVLAHLCMAATGVIFLQLILGATLRHFASDYALVAHVLWAIPVLFLNGWAVMAVLGQGFGVRLLDRIAQTTGLLLVIQLALGGFAWLVGLAGNQWAPWLAWLVPSLHVAVGALLLGSAVLLLVIVCRKLYPFGQPNERMSVEAAAS